MEIRPAALLNGSFSVRRAARDDVGPIVRLLQADAPGFPAGSSDAYTLERSDPAAG
ncbi:hypothetical protein [Arthrobacter sp. zg-Y769]|uniref:hypothetical protein n=1 Tax=Arthrobacter sp. zg-Y769 TaxID=2894191 RepID=UPI001E46F67F|nr:hypothetical protein [Arthrobacter sp. zg-Y769]MCC9206367.1 hypothetical protein [Arthrobacter sp. zg-Y769]